MDKRVPFTLSFVFKQPSTSFEMICVNLLTEEKGQFVDRRKGQFVDYFSHLSCPNGA